MKAFLMPALLMSLLTGNALAQGDPEIIFISGWNDWQYGCQIEPAVEYGFKYVDLAAQVLGREAETAPYRVAED